MATTSLYRGNHVLSEQPDLSKARCKARLQADPFRKAYPLLVTEQAEALSKA